MKQLIYSGSRAGRVVSHTILFKIKGGEIKKLTRTAVSFFCNLVPKRGLEPPPGFPD